MLTLVDFLNNIEETVDDAIAEVDPEAISSALTDLDLPAPSVIDLLTGDTVPDIVNNLLPSIGGISATDVGNMIDDVAPILGQVLGGPFGSAPIFSLATDLLTGQTIGDLVSDGLERWFDRDDYLARNPDVANASVDPFLHFIQFGANESRLPDLFDENFYLASNPDVGATVASDGISSGWAHFLTNGVNEGRLPSPDVNRDVIGAISSTLNELKGIGLL